MMHVDFSAVMSLDHYSYTTPFLQLNLNRMLSSNCEIAAYTLNGFWQSRNGKFFTGFIIDSDAPIIISIYGKKIANAMKIEASGNYLRHSNNKYLCHLNNQGVWQCDGRNCDKINFNS